MTAFNEFFYKHQNVRPEDAARVQLSTRGSNSSKYFVQHSFYNL